MSPPSLVWCRWIAFVSHLRFHLTPLSGFPFCPPCGDGSVSPAIPGGLGSGAVRPAGGPVEDLAPWGARLAPRGFDCWPRGLLRLSQEEAALEASWETRPLYL